MWTMFISICVFGTCSWLEVEKPTFQTISDCEVRSQITRLELLGQLNDGRVTVSTECIPEESREQFRQDRMKTSRLRNQTS